VRPKLSVQYDDVDPHIAWRARYLREAGVDRATAQRVAYDAAFDLHTLVDLGDLVDRGCAPELAVRIVAPLDSDA
jgi:hypothetical protein